MKSTTKGYSIGHWPIPEDHWIDINAKSLVINLLTIILTKILEKNTFSQT